MFPEKKYPSPTGRYVFHIAAWEARMSHWIESFKLVEVGSGALVLHLSDSTWSLDTAEWIGESLVKMHLRKYPGNHSPGSFEVQVDCEARMVEVAGQPAIPLPQLDQALKDLYASRKTS